MQTLTKPKQVDIDKLIEIWKVLEALTVSMDRLGHYELNFGTEAAKEALHQYFGIENNRRIAHARRMMVEILEGLDPDMADKLDELAEDEGLIGYWDGVETAKS
jgi:hypothetical protein